MHPEDCECWNCRVRSISFAPSAMPSRKGGAEAARINAADKKLEADRAAYKRLRHDGLQPRGINDSAHDEKVVESQFDFDLGMVIPRDQRSRVEEGFEMTKGLSMVEPT